MEGLKELMLCIESGFIVDSIYCSSNMNEILDINSLKADYIIDNKIMSQIIMRESEGIFGIFNEKVNEINAIDFSKDEFILILDRPEKPGNVGAIFRSCQAFGFKNIIIAETNLDIYNPIIIRSSLGAVFKLNVFKLSFEGIKKPIKKRKIQDHYIRC